ncbi:Zn-dependent protease with chaperone function [uncultured Leptolyngbya sp.]|uniref:Zn-dependent protease with chaperone function n=1 Tax=uncultured Leptolyngbya sp. TaxID=332963 RepID=A0A6J4MYH6_9CYAN|nr:Zn-dependent protease with chaperone function [uncultured Leptolyngbya sp.]
MSLDSLDTARADYQAGKAAFERGEYRKAVQFLESAKTLVNVTSRFGGEVQIWLVTAYEAMGQRSDALALCREVSRHPDLQIRKQGSRLLYILEAPRLTARPEWLTQIPDLTALGDSDERDRLTAATIAPAKQPEKPAFQLENVIDPQRVNTKDNRFIWVALGAGVLVLGGLVWFM